MGIRTCVTKYLFSPIRSGIFNKQSVGIFRNNKNRLKDIMTIDQNNIRLINSFNDIYVVVACTLVLISASWFGRTISDIIGAVLFAISSWGLANFFVLRHRMALPAIVLLLSFLAGILASSIYTFGEISEIKLLISICITLIFTWIHWHHFKIPITVAVGAGIAISCLLAIAITNNNADVQSCFTPILFSSGMITFIYAVYWDSDDLLRKTRKSDVAFWLHLLSAPLIVHPIFLISGIFEGNSGLAETISVTLFYIGMSFVSVAIDRRAIMVSGLAYVLYAIFTSLQAYGIATYNFAITGISVGSFLLLLSMYWHSCRSQLFKIIPSNLQPYLPPLK
ncbi:MAG: hypothetical protein HRT91_00215 [Piscirickettsiaceae bacterium]|nr:hypothetical protein [Piscirickettsiaceae bacterium]